MKHFCGNAFQNPCPHSSTDLAMKLGWIKDFAPMPPCSQSRPVFGMNFWCGTFMCAADRDPAPCSSHPQQLPLLPSGQQKQQTRAAGCSYPMAKAGIFFLDGDPSVLLPYPPSLEREDWSKRRLKDVSQQHLWSCCLALSHSSHSNPH